MHSTIRLLLLSSFWLVACSEPPASITDAGDRDAGNGDASAAPDAAPTPLDTSILPTRLSQVACDGYANCVFGDALRDALCANVEAAVREGLVPAIDAAAASHRVTLDGAALDACIERLTAVGWCEYGAPTVDEWIAYCPALVHGLVSNGDACGFDWECSSGHCDIATGDCGGTCAPRLAEGEFCDTEIECAPGLRCEVTCEQPLGMTTPPTVVGEGEACDRVIGGLRVCEDGLFCAATSGGSATCRGPLAAGEACPDAIPDMCGDGRYCDNGACRGLPSVGEACLDFGVPQPSTGVRCAGGLGCDGTQHCVTKRASGEACFLSDECLSGSCVSRVCAPLACTER